jgi:predicted DNA-binding protein YlxM (UPF0122 family)
MSKFRQWSYDSEGNRATIINLSEMEAPANIENPNPDYMLDKIIDKLPDIGFGETNRQTEEDQQNTISAVKIAFTLLTAKQRTVIYKKFYQNKINAEIAREMEICSEAVSRLLKRAIKDLKFLLMQNKKPLFDKKNKKSGRRADIEELLFFLKNSIHRSCINKKNKSRIYELIDEIDGIVVSRQRKSAKRLF